MRLDLGRPGNSALQIDSHSAGLLRLDVRRAVAARAMQRPGGAAFYLSLFEDEIEERLDELVRQVGNPAAGYAGLQGYALHLEPTDAIVLTECNDAVLVARGGACNFPLYWSRAQDRIIVSTSLPRDHGIRLSRAGLLDSMAVVAVAYRNEPNFMLRAPLAGWRRIRRGCVSRLTLCGPPSEALVDHASELRQTVDQDGMVAAIRSALHRFGARQRRSRSQAAVELSGGFDSTLTAMSTRNHGIELLGVSVQFPFYEFRFEEDIQKATGVELAISRKVIDGTTVHSFAQPEHWPRLDEPATRIMSLKRDQAVAAIAASAGADRVFVGEGGDELFAEDMLQPVPSSRRLSRALFSPGAWATIEETRKHIEAMPVLRHRSLLTFIYDARLDVAMKESYGTVTRTPFTDLDMTRCGLRWAQLTKKLGARHGKRILADAFKDELPPSVLNRRGKVCWNGVFARAYALHGDGIRYAIERQGDVFDHLGIKVPWLVGRVGELSRWERTGYGPDDGEVFAAYAIATWLESWGIRQRSDCDWSD